jgi:hypothetical protein
MSNRGLVMYCLKQKPVQNSSLNALDIREVVYSQKKVEVLCSWSVVKRLVMLQGPAVIERN